MYYCNSMVRIPCRNPGRRPLNCQEIRFDLVCRANTERSYVGAVYFKMTMNELTDKIIVDSCSMCLGGTIATVIILIANVFCTHYHQLCTQRIEIKDSNL